MKLKAIYESLHVYIDEAALVEDYPTTWNPEEFAKLNSFAERMRYAEQNLKRISSGSGRIVYKIDNEKVLKLAKNKKGVAQNEVEIDYGGHNYFDILAKVFNSDNNGLWVEMELARKVTPTIFKQVNGYSFDEYTTILFNDSGKHRGMHSEEPENAEEIRESEFFNGVMEYLMGTDSPDGDMRRLNSYGLVSRDGADTIMVIDYGLNTNVYGSYCSKKPMAQYYG